MPAGRCAKNVLALPRATSVSLSRNEIGSLCSQRANYCMESMNILLDRFCRYVRIHTQADETATDLP